jgi:hypothetical protein
MARVPSELILNNVELIRLIGEINLLWDEIEMYLWYIFDDLLGRTDWRYSYVIFFSHQGHRVRRDMLQALASVALERNPKRLEQLTKLLSRISDASHKRNNITHGLWNREEGEPGAPITRTPLKRDYQKAAALAYTKKDIARIRDEFVALESDVYAFAEPRWSRSMTKREKLKAKREARK